MSRRGTSRGSRLIVTLVAVGGLALIVPVTASAPCDSTSSSSLAYSGVHPALDRSCAALASSVIQTRRSDGAPTASLDCQGDGKCPYAS